MAKFTFRLIAVNETRHWDLTGTPVEGMDAFGVYLFHEGEATYCCSLSPDAWCESVITEFVMKDGSLLPEMTAEELEEIYEMARDAQSDETGCYFSYGSVNGADPRFLGPRQTIRVDVRDHKHAGNTWRDARIAAADVAREELMDHYRCNSRDSIPVLDEAYVWRDYQRAQSARIIPTLPLMAYGNRT